MARLNVNPTRIQLKTLKQRLIVAKKGHKMLKDKSDELIRRYSNLIKKNYELRKNIQQKLIELFKEYSLAKCYMSNNQVMQTFLLPNKILEINFDTSSILNIPVPNIQIFDSRVKFYENDSNDSQIMNENNQFELPYSFIETNALLDNLVRKTAYFMPELSRLAQLEKSCQILSCEIEKTKRRVNALEFVLIPDYEETIKYIAMKIEENDRTSKIRMIKVKSMIENK